MTDTTGAEAEQGGSGQDKNHNVYFVPGLHRGLVLLEILAAAQEPMSVSEIARALGVTRSSAFRLIYTLRHMGFIESEPGTKNVKLGGRVMSLGFSYLASMSIIETAQPDLNWLRDVTGITAHLGIHDGRDLLYLATAQSRSGFLSTINVGARFPVPVTPMGWLLLSDMSAEEIREMFENASWIPQTEHSPKNVDELIARVDRARRDSHVISLGALEPAGKSVVAPVRDASDRIVAAVDVSGPDSAFPDDLEPTLKMVLAAASRISVRLGATPADFALLQD